MQLLNEGLLAVFATVLIICTLLAIVVTIIVRYTRLTRKNFAALFLPILAFTLLGFVTGQIMGESRESAVSAVLPAVMTLLGGVFIYLIGSKGMQTQIIVSSMVFCFVLALLTGTLYGARLRVDFDAANADPIYLRARNLMLEQNSYVIDAARLRDYVEIQKLKRDFADKEKLDLSRFESVFETKLPSK